jgi:hypothetical protein
MGPGPPIPQQHLYWALLSAKTRDDLFETASQLARKAERNVLDAQGLRRLAEYMEEHEIVAVRDVDPEKVHELVAPS